MRSGTGPMRGQQTHQLSRPGIAGDARISLVLYHRDGAVVAPLRSGKAVVVGRVEPADVVVADNSLSRQHARFVSVEEGVLVEDMASTNGTWVGGESVTVATLRAGDVVVLGAVTAVVQELSEGAPLGLDGHEHFVATVDAEGHPRAAVQPRGDHRHVARAGRSGA